MRFKFILAVCCSGLSHLAHAQLESTAGTHQDSTTSFNYLIDTTLKKEIENEIDMWQEKNKPQKLKGGLMGMEIFTNDVESFSTIKKDKVEFFFPFLNVNEKDKIIDVVGTMGTQSEGSGFRILIHKNECLVFLLVKNDGHKIFKNVKNDTTYYSYLFKKAQFHLTLTKSPSFMKGEIIEGLVELRSYQYYEKHENGDDEKHVNIWANFRTPPLK